MSGISCNDGFWFVDCCILFCFNFRDCLLGLVACLVLRRVMFVACVFWVVVVFVLHTSCL